MTGFEPGSSGIESDRAVNCATNHFCLSGSTQFEKASLENTHLLCKEKYDIMFDWFEFCYFATMLLINNRLTCSAKSKPVKRQLSRTVILPLTK